MKKCKWCGKPFKKEHNRQEYCCQKCRTYALLEQKMIFARQYRKKHSKQRLGTSGLSQHKHESHEKEYEVIQNEMKRLKLK